MIYNYFQRKKRKLNLTTNQTKQGRVGGCIAPSDILANVFVAALVEPHCKAGSRAERIGRHRTLETALALAEPEEKQGKQERH